MVPRFLGNILKSRDLPVRMNSCKILSEGVRTSMNCREGQTPFSGRKGEQYEQETSGIDDFGWLRPE